MSDDYNFKKGFIIYSLSSLFFIIVGILIASGLSLPGGTSADDAIENQPAAINADYQFPVNSEGQSPFVAVAAAVKDAVVNISAESIVDGSNPHDFMFDDEFFRRFFGVPQDRDRDQTPQRQRSQSLGSGFIISGDGYIVTNNHVVRDADKIKVRLSDTSEYPAELVGSDPETDIAVLKIKPNGNLTSASLGSSEGIQVGDWAIAIGNPFPQLGLDRTVTVGVISAIGRQGLVFGGEMVSYQDYIQTDASINRGNSGGPLVNIRGEVIGINSAIASNTGGSVGIGFAIPINLAKPVIESLKNTGEVARGWLGVSPQEVNNDLAEALDLGDVHGVLIGEVIADSPAEEAGLKAGDVITKFNGKIITGLKQFRFLVAETPPDKEVDVEVIRDKKKKDLGVTLGNRSEAMNIAQSGRRQVQEEEKPWLGIKVRTFSEGLADRYRLDFEPGVVIEDIEVGSPAEEDGLQKYDIIIEINGRQVKDKDDFDRIAEDLSERAKAISFFISRRGTTRYLAIKPERG
ncbi:MAG: Do family serine endopeptidase [candidate division Zixibacteria bacterium]|nr:Do family serine endopeptidase [candidate division Zixibacteria bacterium]